MYKKILAAVNEYFNSEIAASYALALARACEAKFLVCFMVESKSPPASLARAQEAVTRLSLEATKRGVEVKAIVDTGDPLRGIGRLVRNEGVDLAFVAARRADIKRRFFAGTLSRRLFVRLPCSVALVRVVRGGRGSPEQILVPLKGRIDHLEERAFFAAKMALGLDSRVVLFHSPHQAGAFSFGKKPIAAVEPEAELPDDMAAFVTLLQSHKVIPDRRSVPGRPGRAITLEALSKRHDLIIMGATRRSLVSQIVKGNPVEEVLREAPCDLIIFSPRRKT